MKQRQSSEANPGKHIILNFKGLALSLLALGIFSLLAASAPAYTGAVWKQINASAPWYGYNNYSWAYQGKLWVELYTWDGSTGKGELWSSTDGIQWTKVNPSLPWDSCTCRPFVFNGKMWVAGCYADRRMWNSTDGVHWMQLTSQTPAETNGINSFIVFNGKLWQLDTSKPGVWCSSDGVNWQLVTNWKWNIYDSNPLVMNNNASYSTVVFDGKLWLLVTQPNPRDPSQVWNTSDGIYWTQVANKLNWSLEAGVATAYDGRMWVIGGDDRAEVWSSRDGKTWSRVTDHAPWPKPRIYTNRTISLTDFKGKLWLMDSGRAAGYDGTSQVWQLDNYPVGPPVLKPYADQTVTAGVAFTSTPPEVSQATEPFQWKLVSGPAGMTIDPDTGAVTWPAPQIGTKAWPVSQRITNARGSATLNWWLTVLPSSPISATVQRITRDQQVTIKWQAVAGATRYRVQSDDATNFATPRAMVDVSTATLSVMMGGLEHGKTLWFQVLAFKQNKLISASAPLPCTRDVLVPTGSMKQATSPALPVSDVVLLDLTAQDPVSPASGVYQMRFSVDNIHWTDWERFKPYKALFVESGGTLNVRGQVCDRAGNIVNLAARATALAPSRKAVFVDGQNASAPWTGTALNPYTTILEALNAAPGGATIIVAPGTYYEHVAFKGKNVALRSAVPQLQKIVKDTIIDGSEVYVDLYRGAMVQFNGAETSSACLEGFTITRAPAGGGIEGNGTHATIRNNRIIYNIANQITNVDQGNTRYQYYTGHGGGLSRCNGLIQNNIIAMNVAGDMNIAAPQAAKKSATPGKTEGGLWPWPPYPPPPTYYISTYDYAGGALFDCDGFIQNNTIYNNATAASGGDSGRNTYLTDIYGCDGVLRNNIIMRTDFDTTTTAKHISYSVVESAAGTGKGNIVTSDAGLVDPDHDNFTLKATSPCIDAGCLTGATRDIDGEARGYDGSAQRRGDGSDFDIGADEYLPASPAVWVLAPAGGTLKAGSKVGVHWKTDVARAGTQVSVELWQGVVRRATLGQGCSAAGEQTLTVRLPQLTGTGFTIRVVSVKNKALMAQTPIMTLVKP